MDVLTLAVVVCVCTLGCVLAAGAGAGSAAAATQFGEEGERSGQLNSPYGVAIDNTLSSSHGDVYVGDRNNRRIDKFTSMGDPLLAWGRHVNEESPAAELQTCTTLCQVGEAGEGAGEFNTEGPRGVAVDSIGDVYVVDWENFRVQKFDPEGKFILMFGWEVNETTHGNICAEEEIKNFSVKCKTGVQGANEEGINEHGQFRWDFEGSYIAVGPGDNVYVGDKARVQIFDSSGAYKEEIPLAEPEFPGFGAVTALTVDASGDVFVKYESAEGVREFTFNETTSEWEEKSTRFDNNPNPFAIGPVALDASGDLYVGDSEPEPGQPGFHVLKYDAATGEELASFGSNTAAEYSVSGMAFANTTGALYATGSNLNFEPRVFVFTPPPPGPLIGPGSEAGTPDRHGAAKFSADINPEGHETTYHVEYITERQFVEDGETYGAGKVTTTESASIGEGFNDQHVEESLPEGALEPGVTYHWRLVAKNSQGTATGADKTLEETPPALIEGPWATEVTATSATLTARINPEGTSTTYRLEYGKSTAYEEHTFSGNVGAGTEFVTVGGYHLQELEPGTTYHYRVVTVNECVTGRTCTQEGADHTFTTRPGASEFALPDGRAWELVTPADTGGASLELFSSRYAASDGGAITYAAKGVPLGENAVSNNSLFATQVLSARGTSGWQHRPANVPIGSGGSQDINTPINPPKEGEDYSGQILNVGAYVHFSPDLASALVYPQVGKGILTPDALEGTSYLRNNADGGYTPLLTPGNTPPGTELMAEEEHSGGANPQVVTLAVTPDLSHIVLGSPLKLTAEAVEYLPPEISKKGIGNLYEWSGGGLRLVNILPGGKVDESQTMQLAGELSGGGQAARALSSDGRRVAWTVGSPYNKTFKGLYVRDMAEEKTVRLGGIGAHYQTMSSDGSRVLFLEKGDLNEYVVGAGMSYDAGTTTDLTASHGPGESSAGVQESVSDVSEDGSYVYFVAKGALSSGRNAMGENAVSGAFNLYLLHREGDAWEAPKFIARLSSEDEKSWSASGGGNSAPPDLTKVSSRVSPGGRYLAFMSNRSLTGYDNVDLNPEAEEARDEEVFLYHASTDRLVCTSCDPSGARPHGVLDGGPKPLLVETGGNPSWGEAGHPHWLAGNLPGWETGGTGDTVYQPRYLSNGGRMFFNSPIALVPQDTNGLEDVYQYEPGGVGDCARTGGCVSLISSGQSASESAFMDASENGDDVFFLSSYRLTAADIDLGYDVWDAHVCSASSPCLTPPASSPPCSSGDSCKPAPAPQPELFGPGPSETFSGAGNLAPSAASKPLTRVQKLSRALSSCRKRYRSKKRLAACKRTAHKRYGHASKRSHKAGATRRGGKR